MIVNKDLITIGLKASTKEEAIRSLAEMAANEGKVTSVEDYINSVLEREKSCTTGIGNGIAIPHGKSKAVKEAIIVFGKSHSDIQWNALDGNPVNMIFLLGVPADNVDNLHLKVLSQLSRKLMNEDFVDLLKNSNTVEEIFTALKDIKVD